MRIRGITLVEMLVVISIVAVVSAILFPVISGARDRSQQARCQGNLKQLHVALMLYRADFDGDVRYGDGSAMGLPTDLLYLFKYKGLPRDLSICNGTPQASFGARYFLMWRSKGDNMFDAWMDHVTRMTEGSVILTDPNHDLPGAIFRSLEMTHRSTGLYLDGHIKTIQKQGDNGLWPFYE